jgi:hypothetical protein
VPAVRRQNGIDVHSGKLIEQHDPAVDALEFDSLVASGDVPTSPSC